jgi:exopolysaccharide biosynthesis polyprenyl glycosylphosphotransferase
MHRCLAAADSIAILTVVAISVVIDPHVSFSSSPEHPLLVAAFAVLAWLGLAGLDGMFHLDDRRIDCSTADEMFRVARMVGLWIWIVFGIDALLTAPGAPIVTEPIFMGLLAVPALLLARDLTRWVAQKQAWFTQRVVLVGTDADRERVRRTVERHPEYGLRIVSETTPDTLEMDLLYLVVEQASHRVIFASSYQPSLERRTGTLRGLAECGVKVDLVPADSDVFRIDAELHHIEGLPLLTLPIPYQPRAAASVKRGVDILGSALALILISPLFAACALAIKLDTRGPVLFRQPRIGRRRSPFSVFKFRTMVANAEDLKTDLSMLNCRDDGMFKIPHDPRITRVGRFLRRYSLDELPQLINVLRGQMSLVGPRPLIGVEARLVDARYEARFNVRPGITGPWQVFGRSDIPFDDMIKLDYTYVTSWSVGYDIKLMVRTTTAMLAGRGAY